MRGRKNAADLDDPLGRDVHAERRKYKFLLNPMGRDLPAHVVPLAVGMRDSYFILIDTERGVAMWGSPDGQLIDFKESRQDLCKEGVDKGGEKWWSCLSTWEIPQLFEHFQKKFLLMEWLPHPYGPTDVWEVAGEDEGENEDDWNLMAIMRMAGRPGDGQGGGWRRSEAEKAMQEQFE
jgi:hypothetical protein